MNKKKTLFISYFYPPVGGKGLPGAQRSVKFVRYLNDLDKYVLTMKTNHYPEYFLMDNNMNIPVNNETVIRTGTVDILKFLLKIRQSFNNIWSGHRDKGASETEQIEQNKHLGGEGLFAKLKDFVSGILTFPDYAGPWIVSAVWNGIKIVKKNNINFIFATGLPWSALTIGWLIKIFTKTKLIVDFRDPWVNNPFHDKSDLRIYADKYLERMIVRSADIVSLNTDELMEDFVKRYSFLPKNKFIVLSNGYDEYDFKRINFEKSDERSDELLLTHAGFLYGTRDPESIFTAIEKIYGKNKEIGEKIKFCQIGNINLNYDINGMLVMKSLQGNYEDLGQIEYSKCLQHMASSDILVIIQPDTKTQIPSKIFEYIYLDKPILVIALKDSALGRLINKYHFGDIFEPDDIDGISDYLVDKFISKQKDGTLNAYYENKSNFDIKNITNTLHLIMENIGNKNVA